jgi:outer membrane receptor protein involved in Fe transport
LLTANINVRASYSRTIARPSFKELSFAQILDPVSNRIFNGGLFAIGSWDGNLSETRINNYDFRWESFFDRGQLFSISVFYKTFEDPIELVRVRAQQTSTEFQPRNVGSAEVFGAEFEIRQSLGFISSALNNFGFNGNVTLVQSVTDITEEEFQARLSREKEGQDVDNSRELAGQAPFLINVGLSYQNPKFGLDGGFFYNVRAETLIRVGGGLFPDVYSEPFHSLNFNLNKSLGQASLSLSVDNILNDSQEESYQAFQSDNEIFNSFNPGRNVSLGFKYAF